MSPLARHIAFRFLALACVLPSFGEPSWDFPPDWQRLAGERIREGVDYACVTFTQTDGDIPQFVHLLRLRPGKDWQLALSPLPATPGMQKTLAEQAEAHGMSYAEAGGLMARLGCVDALNLDGGRSAGLWIDAPALARLKQDPRFARLQFSRPLPNAILIVPAKNIGH